MGTRVFPGLGMVAILLTAACGPAGNPDSTLTAAGSTFVNPIMSKWAYAYPEVRPGVSINYQSVGSAAGIAQLKAGTVDFAASDVPLTDAQIAEMEMDVVQIPIIGGSVVLAYNLPGAPSGLKLSGDAVADIFLGKLTAWNDPRLARLNPGVSLPAEPITVVHRSDGSGTGYIFTDYLSAVSPEWSRGPGRGKSVNWPIGVGGKGTEGVAGMIKQTPGAIGFVELSYALETHMPYARIENRSGAFVNPTVASTAAAANGYLDALHADLRTSIVNTPTPDGYPIAGFTYALVDRRPKRAARLLVGFLTWVLGPGQAMAKSLHYTALSPSVVELDLLALRQVGAR